MNYKIFRYYSLFFLLLCISVHTTHAQYNFKNYNTKNGLAGSTIKAIFQDSKGYIWFGTQGSGISRFDGKVFTNFVKNDGLIANDITCIGEDHSGNIWIGTADGVSKFDGIKFYNYTNKNGLVNNYVYSIYCDDKNDIWFGTAGGGISIYNDKFYKTITTKDGLQGDYVYGVSKDGEGNYWFVTETGISKYDRKNILNYKTDVTNGKSFLSMLFDSKGNAWFGTVSAGVIKYSRGKFENIKIPDEVSKDFIGSIIEDKRGNIWFATDHGALKFDGEKYTLFNETNGLSSNVVLSLTTDYEGNVWMGTHLGGAVLFSSEAFMNYLPKDGLISNKITTLYQTDEKTYIIGTLSNGIVIFSNNVFTHLTSIPGLLQSNISAITSDNQDNLWVGTGEGIFVLKKQNNAYILHRRIEKISNIRLPLVSGIIQDNKNGMWIATYGDGLFKIDGKEEKHYSESDGLITNQILSMYKDNNGAVWLGTYDAGVLKLENNKFINYTERDGLTNKLVWSITEDDNHNMYFGTGEGGISCFNGKEFKTISKKDGLCSDNIQSILWDKTDNMLCLGTDKGINRLKLSSDFTIETIRYYGEQEGFKGGEVNSNAILIDDKGLIWFGTTNGLSVYNRKYDFPNQTPPKLTLNSIHLAYQNVDWNMYTDSVDLRTGVPYNLTLSHKNNHLTFYFQALTTDNVKYTYILEGQDNEWSPLTSNREANFTNITPGKTYVFKAKAINSNGVWSKDEIVYSFTISPPWWQTWWFYIGSFLLLGFGVIGFINYRTAKLAKEKKVLEEKVVERTLELNQSNTRLSEAIHAITDSMNYAQRIQQSFLTSEKVLTQTLKDYFILYKPRDIVSGDFYWCYQLPDRTIIACADCTGHGIPGAFMSLIGLSLLNEISHSKSIIEPAKILDELRRIIILGLNPDQTDTGGKDGMDISVISIMKSNSADEVKIDFAGANSTLCIVTDQANQKELLEYKGDKQPVGYFSNMKPFNQHEITAKKGDILYMFTDGYADQFGGPNGKKFMARQLKRVLLNLAGSPTKQQEEQLESTFQNWRGELEQVDDVTVVGIKLG